MDDYGHGHGFNRSLPNGNATIDPAELTLLSHPHIVVSLSLLSFPPPATALSFQVWFFLGCMLGFID